MFELMDAQHPAADIRVMGVGGAGGKLLRHLHRVGVDGVDTIYVDSDEQALNHFTCGKSLNLGEHLPVSRGLGEGASPMACRRAAFDGREQIARAIVGCDILFIVAGMGGGMGTGAAPAIGKIAAELGILTIAVVTQPFEFEGARRRSVACRGLDQLAAAVDTWLLIPNDNVFATLDPTVSLVGAYRAVDSAVASAVRGVSELLTGYGIISIDKADIRSVTSGMGRASMGLGSARGEGRAIVAGRIAMASPLLDDSALTGARGILINVTANGDMTVEEFEDLTSELLPSLSPSATTVMGTVIDQEMGDELRVTVIATGI